MCDLEGVSCLNIGECEPSIAAGQSPFFVVDTPFIVLLGEMCDEWACKKRAGMGDLLVENLLQTGREQPDSYRSVFLPPKSDSAQKPGVM